MCLLTILLIFTFLLGYFFGKRKGKDHGYQEGTAAMSIILRQKSLEQGYCILCNERQQTLHKDNKIYL